MKLSILFEALDLACLLITHLVPIETAQLSLSTSHRSNRKSAANLCAFPLPVAKEFFFLTPFPSQSQPLEHKARALISFCRWGNRRQEKSGQSSCKQLMAELVRGYWRKPVGFLLLRATPKASSDHANAPKDSYTFQSPMSQHSQYSSNVPELCRMCVLV